MYNHKAIISETEFLTVYEWKTKNKIYNIYETKKIANKYTYVNCVDDSISWQQNPRIPKLYGKMYGDEIVYLQLSRLNRDVINVFLIKGKPGMISGLDEGKFLSYKNIKNGNYIYVLTKRRLKEFLD